MECFDDGAVGAPVPAQGEPLSARGVPGGFEVDGDVRTPEPVDRLLRVTDHHQRGGEGRSTEQRGEDLPLDAIRVLEFVDQHDLEPVAQRIDDRRHRVFHHCVTQLGQDVVEAHRA